MRLVSINDKIYKDYLALAAEYLPSSDKKKIEERSRLSPNSFVAVMIENEVAGVAFGWARGLDASEDNSFVLDGIAVKGLYQHNGYGKILLAAFENSAREYGFKTVSVGSAGGYVEKFYIDNGFEPICYKTFDQDGIKIEKEFSSIDAYYGYNRINADGFVVMQKILR